MYFLARSKYALAVATLFLALCAPAAPAAPVLNGKLQIIHLDAGQGDGAVIITPGGQVAMFDDGTNFTVGTSGPSCIRVKAELDALGITHIDLHFASHYHADHIGCISRLDSVPAITLGQ